MKRMKALIVMGKGIVMKETNLERAMRMTKKVMRAQVCRREKILTTKTTSTC